MLFSYLYNVCLLILQALARSVWDIALSCLIFFILSPTVILSPFLFMISSLSSLYNAKSNLSRKYFLKNSKKYLDKLQYSRYNKSILKSYGGDNTNELKAAMVRKGLTQKDVADSLNISAKTLSNRISRGVFGSDEIECLMKLLDITDPMPIFFAKAVT